jgi:hypothetical protein
MSRGRTICSYLYHFVHSLLSTTIINPNIITGTHMERDLKDILEKIPKIIQEAKANKGRFRKLR